MFSYYGGKSKIARYYPKPTHSRIIEPFAGSARYSMLYPDCEVRLNDSNPTIARIWDYLIHATEGEIAALPELKKGESLRDVKQLSPVERDLLGFAVNRGGATPSFVVTKWASKDAEIPQTKRRILRMLPRIRHWKITNLDYRGLSNEPGTWFIDPPYMNGGEKYPHHRIDFRELGNWCQSRAGQVIVCESEGADWLPFVPLKRIQGQGNRNRWEMIWTNSTREGGSCPTEHGSPKPRRPLR